MSFKDKLEGWRNYISPKTRWWNNRRARRNFWGSLSNYRVDEFNQGQPWLN